MIRAGYNVGDTSESTDYIVIERYIHPEYSVNRESDVSSQTDYVRIKLKEKFKKKTLICRFLCTMWHF